MIVGLNKVGRIFLLFGELVGQIDFTGNRINGDEGSLDVFSDAIFLYVKIS